MESVWRRNVFFYNWFDYLQNRPSNWELTTSTCVYIFDFLAEESSVFFRMFETDMKEKRDTEMTITDVEPAIVEKMIRYVYSEKFTGPAFGGRCRCDVPLQRCQ